MSKDQWFTLFEQKLFELEDEGYPSSEAEDLAAQWATETQKDQAADYADMKYQQLKDERNGH